MQKLNTIGFALLDCLSFNLAVAGLDTEYQQQSEQEQAATRAAKKRQADEARQKIERDRIAREQAAEVARQARERVAQAMQIEMVAIPNTRYEIGKYEVTQGQWKAVMGSNPSYFKKCGDTCPVERVSWNDIQEFLQKLNAQTGKNYRLPSESEWQTACLAGNQTKYCGGNDLDAVAWYDGNSGNKTHPVGQKQPNAYGLYDMGGNVWEWMQDKYDNEHDDRVQYGGSWLEGTYYLRAAFRSSTDPSKRYSWVGFRLARTLP